jgi:hypothetical protein
MTRIILATILLLTLAVPPAATALPNCKTVYSRGNSWCACWVTGKGWRPAPKLACTVLEARR